MMLSIDELIIVFIPVLLLGTSFFSAVAINLWLVLIVCLAAEAAIIYLLRGRLNICVSSVLWLCNTVIMFLYADTYRGTLICFNLFILTLTIWGICLQSHPQDKRDLNGILICSAVVLSHISIGFALLDCVFKTKMLPLYKVLLSGKVYQNKLFWMKYEQKYYGLSEYPNVLSMAGMLILCYALFIMPKERKKSRLIAIVLSFAAILVAGERSNILIIPFAIIVSQLIGAHDDRLNLTLKVLLAVAAVVILIFMMQPFLMQFRMFERVFESLSSVGEEGADISNGRDGLYSAAINNWKRSPIIGNGWFYYYYNNTDHAIMGNTNVHTHNLILELLSDLGLLGGALFLSPMVITLIQNIRAVYLLDPKDSKVMKLTLAIQIHFIIDSLFHVTFYSINMISFYFFAVGIFQNACYLKTRYKEKENCAYIQERTFGQDECDYFQKQN